MKDFIPWYAPNETDDIYCDPKSAISKSKKKNKEEKSVRQYNQSNKVVQNDKQPNNVAQQDKLSLATIVARNQDKLTRVMMEISVNLRTLTGKREGNSLPLSGWEKPLTEWMSHLQCSDIADVIYLDDNVDKKVLPSGVHDAVVIRYLSGHIVCYVVTLNEHEEIRVEEYAVNKSVTELPVFADNKQMFLDALRNIAAYAYDCSYQWWGGYFYNAGLCLEGIGRLKNQKDIPPIPDPFIRYLCAEKNSRMGGGMGAWFDLPNANDPEFIRLSRELSKQSSMAVLYAINNC